MWLSNSKKYAMDRFLEERASGGSVHQVVGNGIRRRLRPSFREATRESEHAAIGQRQGGRIPAPVVHARQSGPCVCERVVDTGLVDALIVEEMAADDEQAAIRQEAMPGAEEIYALAAIQLRRLRGGHVTAGDGIPEEEQKCLLSDANKGLPITERRPQ
jgi:hypothetical protein